MKVKGYELRLMVFILHSVNFAGDRMLPLISQMFAFLGTLIFYHQDFLSFASDFSFQRFLINGGKL